MDLRRVEQRLQKRDRALKLRDPGGDCPHIDVLRKGRDGRYAKIGIAKKEWLGDGSALLATLKKNDMWEQGGAEKFMDEMDETERLTKRTMRRKRKDEFVDVGREERDIIHRRKGKRINNAGVPDGFS